MYYISYRVKHVGIIRSGEATGSQNQTLQLKYVVSFAYDIIMHKIEVNLIALKIVFVLLN